MMKLIYASAAIGLMALPVAADNAPSAETCTDVSAQPLHTTTVKVNGMVCDFCAQSVTKVFTKNELVDAVDIDLDEGTIIFETIGCTQLDDDTIKEMVHYSGYDFVSIERAVGAATLDDKTATN